MRGSYRPRLPDFVPALATEQGMSHFTAVNEEKKRSASRRGSTALAFAGGLLATAGLIALSEKGLEGVAMACGVAGLLSLMVYANSGPAFWSEQEYYRIPGSRDSDNEHRCIHCGHRGLYRHGQYKSDVQYADCTKCKKTLWIS